MNSYDFTYTVNGVMYYASIQANNPNEAIVHLKANGADNIRQVIGSFVEHLNKE